MKGALFFVVLTLLIPLSWGNEAECGKGSNGVYTHCEAGVITKQLELSTLYPILAQKGLDLPEVQDLARIAEKGYVVFSQCSRICLVEKRIAISYNFGDEGWKVVVLETSIMVPEELTPQSHQNLLIVITVVMLLIIFGGVICVLWQRRQKNLS